MIAANNHTYMTLLNLATIDNLQQVIMKGMPYLQLRAKQMLHS